MKIDKPQKHYERAQMLARLVAKLPNQLLHGRYLYTLKISRLDDFTFCASYSIQQKRQRHIPEKFLVYATANNVFDAVAELYSWVLTHRATSIHD